MNYNGRFIEFVLATTITLHYGKLWGNSLCLTLKLQFDQLVSKIDDKNFYSIRYEIDELNMKYR